MLKYGDAGGRARHWRRHADTFFSSRVICEKGHNSEYDQFDWENGFYIVNMYHVQIVFKYRYYKIYKILMQL